MQRRVLSGVVALVSVAALISTDAPGAVGAELSGEVQAWTPYTRLSHSVATSRTPVISAEGDTINVAWDEAGLGIVHKRSPDGGATWSSFGQLGAGSLPAIASEGADVYVAWQGADAIGLRRSTNGGLTWSDTVEFSALEATAPSVATRGQDVYLAWSDASFGDPEIVYVKSTDNGLTWSDIQRVTWSGGSAYTPSLALDTVNLHVGWRDTSWGPPEVVHKRSEDGGATWSSFHRVTQSPVAIWDAEIAVSADELHVIWQRAWKEGVIYKHSTDAGVTWSAYEQLNPIATRGFDPSIAVEGANIHVAWSDFRWWQHLNDWDNEIIHGHSSDGGQSWTRWRISASEVAPGSYSWTASRDPAVAVTGGVVHVVWADGAFGGAHSNTEIVYKRTTG